MVQTIVTLADGADCVSDFAVIHDRPAPFGRAAAASRSTARRAFDGLGPGNLPAIASARAHGRAAVWAAGAGPQSNETIIDMDATILRTKADGRRRRLCRRR